MDGDDHLDSYTVYLDNLNVFVAMRISFNGERSADTCGVKFKIEAGTGCG
jgi:hypothetical protein